MKWEVTYTGGFLGCRVVSDRAAPLILPGMETAIPKGSAMRQLIVRIP
jgi:hypothetical protein